MPLPASSEKIANPTNKRFVTLGVYAFMLYVTLLLLYPVLISREASFCIFGDNEDLAFAFLNKLSTSIHKGYFPIWDANTYGGKNFPGEFQSGIFYPPNILWCLLFGSVKGIDVYYIDLLISLHYFICLIGMFKVVRLFHMSTVAALGAALIFTYTGIIAEKARLEAHIFYGLALLPWVIYFLCRFYTGQRRRLYLVLSGIVAGLQILAGHLQPFFHTMIIASTVIVYFEAQEQKSWKQILLSVTINLSFLLLIVCITTFPQLYYSVQYMSNAYRNVNGMYLGPTEKMPLQWFLNLYVLKPSDFENLLGQKSVIPDDYNYVYFGILPLFLCILFLLKKRLLNLSIEHRLLLKIITIIFLIGLCTVFGYLTFFPYLLYEIPFVNTVRELSRYVVLMSFSISLLVGLALNYLLQLAKLTFDQKSKIGLFLFGGLALNAVYWILFQQKHIPIDVSAPFLFGFLFVFLLITVKMSEYMSVLAIVFIVADLWLNPVAYESSRSMFYPTNFFARNRIFDFLETTYGKYRVNFDMANRLLVRRNLGDVYAIQTKIGWGGTIYKPYYDFITSGRGPEIDDLLNIKYIISDKILDSNFVFRDSSQQLMLYERKNCYPRCYWKHQLGQPGTAIEVENKGTIRQLAYSDLYQRWSIKCAESDTLIFSENDYPGWKCYDDGKETPIYQPTIKHYPLLFRSIYLDKGEHVIEFRYKMAFHWF